MSRPKKYLDELIARGVRLAIEPGRPITQVAGDLGMVAETLRRMCARRRPTAASGRTCRPARPADENTLFRHSRPNVRKIDFQHSR
jgi:transposase-like protein